MRALACMLPLIAGCIEFQPVEPRMPDGEGERSAVVYTQLQVVSCETVSCPAGPELRLHGSVEAGRDVDGAPRIAIGQPIHLNGVEVAVVDSVRTPDGLERVWYDLRVGGAAAASILESMPLSFEAEVLGGPAPDLASLLWAVPAGPDRWPAEADRSEGLVLVLGGRAPPGATDERWAVEVSSPSGWRLHLSRVGALPDTLLLPPAYLPPPGDSVAEIRLSTRAMVERDTVDLTVHMGFSTYLARTIRLVGDHSAGSDP